MSPREGLLDSRAARLGWRLSLRMHGSGGLSFDWPVDPGAAPMTRGMDALDA